MKDVRHRCAFRASASVVRPAATHAVLVLVGLMGPGGAVAQAQSTLPALPPPTAEPSRAPPPLPPPPPPPPPALPPGPYVYAPAPPGPAAFSLAERRHAPPYALWLGGSLGILAYSGALFTNDPSPPPGNSGIEYTGNFIRPGIALQGDLGARLARRYIPYLTLEVGLAGAGRRFDGTQTNASTSFLGLGFRYLAGDVDALAFAIDISFGVRKFQLSNSSGTWSTTALEIFRLGFGADIRLTSQFTLTPMLTLSGGAPSDTSGYIAYAPNQSDQQTHPPFTGGPIPGYAQQTYFAVVLGCGAHFDLFGR